MAMAMRSTTSTSISPSAVGMATDWLASVPISCLPSVMATAERVTRTRKTASERPPSTEVTAIMAVVRWWPRNSTPSIPVPTDGVR